MVMSEITLYILLYSDGQRIKISSAYLKRDDQRSNEMTKEKLNCFPRDKFNPHYAAHSGGDDDDDD